MKDSSYFYQYMFLILQLHYNLEASLSHFIINIWIGHFIQLHKTCYLFSSCDNPRQYLWRRQLTALLPLLEHILCLLLVCPQLHFCLLAHYAQTIKLFCQFLESQNYVLLVPMLIILSQPYKMQYQYLGSIFNLLPASDSTQCKQRLLEVQIVEIIALHDKRPNVGGDYVENGARFIVLDVKVCVDYFVRTSLSKSVQQSYKTVLVNAEKILLRQACSIILLTADSRPAPPPPSPPPPTLPPPTAALDETSSAATTSRSFSEMLYDTTSCSTRPSNRELRPDRATAAPETAAPCCSNNSRLRCSRLHNLACNARFSCLKLDVVDALLSISGVVRAEADNFRDCPSTTTARDLGVTEWDLFAEEGQRPSSVPEMALLLIEELLTGFPLTVAEEHPEELSFLPSELLDIELSLDHADLDTAPPEALEGFLPGFWWPIVLGLQVLIGVEVGDALLDLLPMLIFAASAVSILFLELDRLVPDGSLATVSLTLSSVHTSCTGEVLSFCCPPEDSTSLLSGLPSALGSPPPSPSSCFILKSIDIYYYIKSTDDSTGKMKSKPPPPGSVTTSNPGNYKLSNRKTHFRLEEQISLHVSLLIRAAVWNITRIVSGAGS
ncbi:hypothetical protein C0J52_16622 [Blattella germanica]|nr:hypothetical protein C0J52_16622 [Blattella germanica]